VGVAVVAGNGSEDTPLHRDIRASLDRARRRHLIRSRLERFVLNIVMATKPYGHAPVDTPRDGIKLDASGAHAGWN